MNLFLSSEGSFRVTNFRTKPSTTVVMIKTTINNNKFATVKSIVSENIHPVDIIKTTFPMGSMTGAPKISAMQIIENLEETKRGLYSGAVGYFTPEGDFDFNVVIRSILYNASKKYVSYSVGGAITAKSDPLKEYEECLIKAKAMREVLED